MFRLSKIIYIKDIRNGRYISICFLMTLFSLNIYLNTYVFFSLMILFPKKFINQIWSDDNEFPFFFIFSNKNLSIITLANKFITFLELNLLFFISSFLFINELEISQLVKLNIFGLLYFIISDFLFYLKVFKKISLFNQVVKVLILVIFGQIMLLTIFFFKNSLLELVILLFLITTQVISYKYLIPKIKLKKYIND